MADALFTINADSSNQGFDATASQVLSLRLKTQPPSGVQSVRFQVWDANAFDPVLDPIRNPPRKAKASPNLTLVGSTSGPNVSPVTIDAAVQVTMPGTTGHAWIVRCVVNGGVSELDDGRVVFDRSLVHERMIVVRDANGARPIGATETTQYEADGWAPEAGRQGPAGADGAPFTPATGSSTGYLSRRVYANAASTRVGTTFAGVTVQAAPASLATVADLPDGGHFIVDVAPGTAGGGGGLVGQLSGGLPSGAGARHRRIYARAELVAMLPIPLTVGIGGLGGLGMQMTGATTVRAGQPGSSGNHSAFGPQHAYPGGRGEAGNNSQRRGGTGGGIAAPGLDGGNSSLSLLGGGAATAGAVGVGFEGAGSSSVGVGGIRTSQPSVWGGASGAGRTETGDAAGSPANLQEGGNSVYGGAGGGVGGTNGANPPAFQNGGKGGGRFTGGVASGSGAAAGIGVNALGKAGNGGNGADGDATVNGDGGAGGGSNGFNNFVSGTLPVDGGDGGDGGFPAGAAGGGGNVRTQPNAAATNTGGKGGKGGDGMIMITALP